LAPGTAACADGSDFPALPHPADSSPVPPARAARESAASRVILVPELRCSIRTRMIDAAEGRISRPYPEWIFA